MRNDVINIEIKENNPGIGIISGYLFRAFIEGCSEINILVFDNRGKAKVL